jgi:L-asparaginase / beta-aspartyl-peptidase
MTISLIVHGGAGTWRPGSDADAIMATTEAVAIGRAILQAGGSALEAAVAAAVALEDNPIFNAGTGGVLNYDGFVEFDACVMVATPAGAEKRPKPPQIGAVSALQRVKNPILVARQVMEMTDHVMLSGGGAQRFARALGHADYDPITVARHADWQSKKLVLDKESASAKNDVSNTGSNLKMREFIRQHPDYAGGTIGAVALDDNGMLCACTSTGGVTMKLVGRVGDTALPGCGTYATPYAAISATGTGEFVIRALAARQIADNVMRGMSLKAATDAVLDDLVTDFDADVGFIGIDANGVAVGAHRTAHMPHAWFSGCGEIIALMRQAQ